MEITKSALNSTANLKKNEGLTDNFDNVSAPKKNAETFIDYSAENSFQIDRRENIFCTLPLEIHLNIIHDPNLPFQGSFNLSRTCKYNNGIDRHPDSLKRYAPFVGNINLWTTLPQYLLLSKEGTEIVKSTYGVEFGPLMRKKINTKAEVFSDALKTIKIKQQEARKIADKKGLSGEYADVFIKYSADNSFDSFWQSPLASALRNKSIQYLVDHDILAISDLKEMNPNRLRAISDQWVTEHISRGTFTFDEVIKARLELLKVLITKEGKQFIDENLETLKNKQHFPDGMLAVADLIGVSVPHKNGQHYMEINPWVEELCKAKTNSEKGNCSIQ